MAPSAAAVQTVQAALATATAALDDELARLRARTAENFAAPRVLSPAKRRLIARAASSPAYELPPRPAAPYVQTLAKTDEAYAEPAICYEQYTAARNSRIVQDMPIAHLPCVGGEGALWGKRAEAVQATCCSVRYVLASFLARATSLAFDALLLPCRD